MKQIFYYFERDMRKWSRSRINGEAAAISGINYTGK